MSADIRTSALQTLTAGRVLRLPAAVARVKGKAERIMWSSNWGYASVTLDPVVGSARPDALVFNDFRRVAVYLNRTVDATEVEALADVPLDAVEIWADRAEDVLRTAPRWWVYCGILQRAQAERERLAKRRELDQKPSSGWWPEDSPVVATWLGGAR